MMAPARGSPSSVSSFPSRPSLQPREERSSNQETTRESFKNAIKWKIIKSN